MTEDFDLGDWLTEETVAPTPVEPSKPTLTSLEVSILTFVEQIFWETGVLPTAEAVAEELNCRTATALAAFKNETFRQALVTKGIPVENFVIPGQIVKTSKALSPKQILVANLMLNVHDNRSQREKLSWAQVSSQQYHAWLRQPAFVEFVNKRAEQMFGASDHLAYRSLIKNVTAGDPKSLDLFFRMRGIYNPSLNVNLNINAVLTQVIEIVSRHVSPQVMQTIANELDAVIEAEEVA